MKKLCEQLFTGKLGQSKDFRIDIFLIEDKGSGTGLIQEFEIDGGNLLSVPVRGFNPGTQDKVLRSTLLQGKVRTKCVYVPKFHPRLESFLAFFTAFPNGRYKDPVDAFTQLSNFALKIKASKRNKRGSTFYKSTK